MAELRFCLDDLTLEDVLALKVVAVDGRAPIQLSLKLERRILRLEQAALRTMRTSDARRYQRYRSAASVRAWV